ncbi:hypothetical protein SEA_SCAP1_48 [Streptomyces phage Scap1]|uniref:Uncharacterized protein n=1 Tax=Streptomyces phage Scap1 TaxID=2041354 RepID=A0A2D1GNV0_9CAUD|nr:hypothetical protein FDI71_gp48 [Streptomyces phage Scap1]ATN93697.1 hypothetical protein SEA_SCAP1_48 [Streptomyces phage Scap1]
MNDTVFDREMTVLANKPAGEIDRRLKSGYPLPAGWAYILVGETKKLMTVSEFANREKIAAVTDVINEVLDRQEKRPLKGHARKLYADRMAKKIIDLI